MTTERNPHRPDRIMDAAEDLATIWRNLGPEGRRMVNEHVGRDLYKALHVLAIEVEGRVPLPEEPDEDDGTVNGAPGVTGFAPPVETSEEEAEPEGYYPLVKRVADLEGFLEARHVRREALHHARKAWVSQSDANDEHQYAREITTLAQAFERYLTDGTVHQEPTSTVAAEPVTTWPGPDFPTRPDIAAVITAAVIWADRAHFLNPGGPENWRNWSDEHDQTLINAVAVLTGRPEIHVEKP